MATRRHCENSLEFVRERPGSSARQRKRVCTLVLLLPSRARSYFYDRVQVPRVRCIPALQSACSVSRRAYKRTRRRARSTRRRSGGGLRTPAASSLKRKRSSKDGRSASACTRRPRRQTRTRKGSWPPSRSRRSGLARGGTRTRATSARVSALPLALARGRTVRRRHDFF